MFGNLLKFLLIATAAQIAVSEYSTLDMKYQIDKLTERLDDVEQRLGSFQHEFSQTLLQIASKGNSTSLPSSCSESFEKMQSSGVYHIYMPDSGLKPFAVYCLEDEHGTRPWTVIQRRVDNETDFFRDWEDYKNGFGDLNGNFFIGLDRLHALTSDPATPQELWVQLKDNVTANARYDRFAIGDEYEVYALKVLGRYTGSAGDSLRRHVGMKFSTKDSDNDLKNTNCAVERRGAWWYKDCNDSNLNGVYGSSNWATGVNWIGFRHLEISMKYAHMAIRPARK